MGKPKVQAGGVFASSALSIDHSIIAENFGGLGPDLLQATNYHDIRFSLIGNRQGTRLLESHTPESRGNLVGDSLGRGVIDPLLLPLADNGGPTKTHRPLWDSLARDRGDPDYSTPMEFDQRGTPHQRVNNGRVDVGAFELQCTVVSTLVDESDGDLSAGDLSLREALEGSEVNECITFESSLSGGTIELTAGELPVRRSLVIDAASLPHGITIDASGSDATPDKNGDGNRVFRIDDGNDNNQIDVVIRGLAITGGDVVGDGGGILSREILTLADSTVWGNSAQRDGGGLRAQSPGRTTVINSTISGNSALSGGGIRADGGLALAHSTITQNSAESVGGVSVLQAGTSIRNSIVAQNQTAISSLHPPDLMAADPMLLLEYSIIGSNLGTSFNEAPIGEPDANGNLIGDPNGEGLIDPLLGPLAENGGRLRTHALLDGSPAIDAGDPGVMSGIDGLPPFDQRGGGFLRVAMGRIDIGSYESICDLVVNTLVDEGDGTCSGPLSLRDAVILANSTVGLEEIRFDASLDGGRILLEHGEISITDTVTIDGRSVPVGITVDASGSDPTPYESNRDGSRIFLIDDGATSRAPISVTIAGLKLTGGDVSLGGGAIFSREDLTIISSTIFGHSAGGSGGGVYATDVSIDTSTIHDNAAGSGGGGLYAVGNAEVADSTFFDNIAGSSGGAISGRVKVVNSTISRNTANRGGGVSGSPITIDSTTIVRNSANDGGGIYLLGPLAANVINDSIVALNNGRSPDLGNRPLSLLLTNSLIGDNTGTGLTEAPIGSPDANGNLIGDPNGQGIIDLLLSPLGNFGGPTQTHTLLPGSPATNMGDPNFEQPPDHDQRGAPFDRVSGGRIDMGAFEYQIAPINFTDDEQLDCADVDAVVAAIVEGSNPTPYDFTGDAIVDQDDLDVWLALAGLHNLPSHAAYPRGDANLDGKVDSTDLNTVGLNWRQEVTGWCSGDFNADGLVDASDLNVLALNWQQDVSGNANARLPRAGLARDVVAIAADGRDSVAESKQDDRRTNDNLDSETNKPHGVDTLTRRRVRRYAVYRNSLRPVQRDLAQNDQQQVLDEVLKRWDGDSDFPAKRRVVSRP